MPGDLTDAQFSDKKVGKFNMTGNKTSEGNTFFS